jgi:glycerol-3-phosphate O-acyltransferase/dihydroxyacetone phosphate acyltransferase
MALRAVLVRLFHSVVRLYFRRIERVGEPPAATTGGRLFVSNHQNALVDPILVLTDAPCDISPIAKSTLWSIPGLKYLLDAAQAVPLVRRKDSPDKDARANDATFERIADHLAGGGNVLIFPEGKSHSEPRVAPLRTGAARMLLMAEQRAGADRAATDLTFQAVALEFDARDKFRSRCLVLWGPVRRLAEVEGEGEARVKAVTATMEADLKELLVEGETHDERLLIARVAEMLANDAGHDSLEGWNTIGRQVELASKTFAALGGTTVADVGHRVGAYYRELARVGLHDWQLSHGRAPSAGKPWTRWVARLLLAPLALPGLVVYAPPYLATKLVAHLTPDADVVSTAKLGTGLVAYPLWMIACAVTAWLLAPAWLAAAATALIVASPFAALSWLDDWEARAPGMDAVASEEQVGRIARLRAEALEAIARARAQLGAG